jgi:MinD-like ATPase involved in chromosome partitioning or flagellar assembly
MIHFDEAIGILAKTCPKLDGYSELSEITVIRDLHGRLSLFVALRNSEDEKEFAESISPSWVKRLEESLAPFWGGSVWVKRSHPTEAETSLFSVIEESRQPWPDRYPRFNSGPEPFLIERRFSKSAWAPGKQDQNPPWEISEDAPGIVTFHSFKGGVGRTTLLSAVAMSFAREGYRVLVVDLDLESPGLGKFFLGDQEPPYGVVDYLLERSRFDDSLDMEQYVGWCRDPAIIGSGPEIVVMPAGVVNQDYIEKLARLDFESMVEQQVNPLTVLLEDLKQRFEPDLILLDARAGLHEVGGLTLMGLSHLDVILGIHSEQSWQGMETLVGLLGRLKVPPLIQVVQALAPGEEPAVRPYPTFFGTKSYQVFLKSFYRDEVPYIFDWDSAHYPLSIRDNPLLRIHASWKVVGELANVFDEEPGFRVLLRMCNYALRKPIPRLTFVEGNHSTGPADQLGVERPAREERKTELLKELSKLADHLDILDVSSEASEDFLKQSYGTPDFQRCLSHAVMIITGDSGSGKSHLARWLLSPNGPQTLMRSSPRSTESFSRSAFFIKGLGEASETGSIPGPAGFEKLVEERPEKEWPSFWLGALAFSMTHSELPVFRSEGAATEISGSLVEGLFNDTNWLKSITGKRGQMESFLDSTDKRLKDQQHLLYVIYDLGTVSDHSQLAEMSLSLLDFWKEALERWERIRPKIFLRTDSWKELWGSPSFNYFHRYVIELTWDTDSLYSLVLKRVLNTEEGELRQWIIDITKNIPREEPNLGWNYYDRPDHERLARDVFLGEALGRPAPGFPSKFHPYFIVGNRLLDTRSRTLPGVMLNFWGQAAILELKYPNWDEAGLIQHKHVAGAVQKVSEELVRKIEKQSDWVGELHGALNNQVVPMRKKEFLEILDGIRGKGVEQHSGETRFNRMKDSGMAWEADDGWIHVPDIYLSGLGLKRKPQRQARKREEIGQPETRGE